MAIGDKVYPDRPMVYGGRHLDARQVTELLGLRNDELLQKMGRLVPVPGGAEMFKCGECGAEFVDEVARGIHGNNRHS